MTVFGINTPPTAYPAHHLLLGGSLGYVRYFYGPGARVGWKTGPLAHRLPGDVPVISVKSWYAADFAALLDTIPADVPVFRFAIQHEPEDEIGRGSVSPAQIQAWYSQARAIRDQHPNGPQCELVGILSWYALTVNHFDWRRLTGALELCDVVGVDSYALVTDLKKNVYTSPAALFAPALAISLSLGLPWAVPEFGVLVASDLDPVRHADKVEEYAAYAQTHGARWMSWWCNIASDGSSYHLDGPGMGMALSVWHTAVRVTAAA